MVGSKFDLTLPIFKHWNEVFNEYGYELVNEHYYSSKYTENCISIVPINIEKPYNQYYYPCIVHGCSGKGFGIKFKQWKNLGSKFDCENSNSDVEIHTPKGSKAEEVANYLELKVVND